MGGVHQLWIVDAHHHFWNPSRTPQPWMTAEHAAIDRVFEPSDLAPLIDACGIRQTVLVQSAASDDDTDYMFELVQRVGWVGAVTAWIRLDDVEVARTRLGELRSRPKFRAVRHLIHTETDGHWILRPEVSGALELLQEHGVLLELPAVFPRHLGDVPELARRYPALTIVIDHLGKPPLGSPEMQAWQEELFAAAAHNNVAAKVSGLNTLLPRDWQSEDLEPAVEAALASFGSARLLFGSDWPVALLNGSYAEVVRRTIAAIRALAGAEADSILGENAARLYRFER
jgi:L-fuconolactonase